MKRLENVMDKAKNLFAMVNAGKSQEHLWIAMSELKLAVSLVDQLPPPPKDDLPA